MSETRHRHRRKSKRFKNSFFGAFKQEFLIGILFLLGVFLLVEDLEIKEAIYNGILNFFRWISESFSSLVEKILEVIQSFEGSDIVGNLLIIMAIVLFIIRIRSKAIERYGELSRCPECDAELVRVHRNAFQRLTGDLFRLKIQRYRCKSCDFDGLRIRSLRSR